MQIQALDRTQPGLPLRQGKVRPQTHDDKRHGTTTLFAALNAQEGTVIGRCAARHRHQEYLQFLDHPDGQTPADRQVHLIVNNYATHKHRKVQVRFKKHPRLAVHYTPTGASWLNMVERFFRDLKVRRVRSGGVWERGRIGGGDHRLHPSAQPAAQAFHLDGQGPRHSGQSHPRSLLPE